MCTHYMYVLYICTTPYPYSVQIHPMRNSARCAKLHSHYLLPITLRSYRYMNYLIYQVQTYHGKINHSDLLPRHHGRYPSPVTLSKAPKLFSKQNMLTKTIPSLYISLDQTKASKWHTCT